MAERLQKLMSQAGIASRRESENINHASKVKINGIIVNIDDKAALESDRIEVNGRLLTFFQSSKHIYTALNKPNADIHD
jgi:23S rRNA pseudouridine2605 synthase